MIDLAIVIPLGISSPGTPVLQYLKWCVESLQNQKTNYNYKIIFACDDNVSDEIKDYLKSTNCDISWYDEYYFFRKGSIWKKIFNEWMKADSKCVAFCHYDDVWSDNKIENQLDQMIKDDLDCTWSCVKIIDENNNILSGDVSGSIGNCLTQQTIKLGGSYAFSHSTILNKHKFLNCGIENYIDISAAIYEQLHFIYCHKLKNFKNTDSVFYHRTHSNSISNTLHTETQNISNIRNIANYSLDEIKKDTTSIDIKSIIQGIYTE